MDMNKLEAEFKIPLQCVYKTNVGEINDIARKDLYSRLKRFEGKKNNWFNRLRMKKIIRKFESDWTHVLGGE